MKKVIDFLSAYRGGVVLLSGGNDSLALCLLAKEVFKKNYICITIKYPYTPSWTLKRAEELAKKFKLKHKVVEMNLPYELKENQPLRCYWCKKYMFKKAAEFAKKNWVLLEGSTLGEEGRNGLRAAWEEGVISPFIETNIGKEEVLSFLKEKGITPAPPDTCLLTRLPFRKKVDLNVIEKLDRLEESVRKLVFTTVRARLHEENLIRLEADAKDIDKIFSHRKEILKTGRKLGFSFITVDLEGYREGSMWLTAKKLKG